MSDELEAEGWHFAGVVHGFAPRGRDVADGLHLVRVRQVHGAEILSADDRTASPAGDADALVTASPGVAVAIATADCVPILIVANEGPVVAAVHAGWRGTLAEVAERTVERLTRDHAVRASDLCAALGPSIDGCCFEIEREIAARFAERFGDAIWEAWRDGRPGKGTLDLREINRQRLVAAGMAPASIQRVGPCTACGGGPFASYRREGAGAGRQLSWIGIEGKRASSGRS